MDENVVYLSAKDQVRRRGWRVVGVMLYNQLFTHTQKLSLYKKRKDADGVVGLVGFTDVTHRSSSSLGSFLLMTASSLFVNI